MSSRRHKNQVLRKDDNTSLTRQDLQFDLLQALFTDSNEVFTDPFQIDGGSARSRVTFRNLYVNAIMNSPKASKLLKEKMADAEFATHFAMLSLLTNVGRVNTTMSFFPEMKTAIRTYHPVPALQKTNGSLQDAPRLKSILKGIVYDHDKVKVATTLNDCRRRLEEGIAPPTNIANLVFILSNESYSISKLHFSNEVDLLDLFTPMQVSSKSRARAFLWLVYNYYEAAPGSTQPESSPVGGTEGTTPNPFSDPAKPGERPPLEELTETEAALENVDPADEQEISEKLVSQRIQFLTIQSQKVDKDDESVISVDSTTKAKGKRRGGAGTGKGKTSKATAHEPIVYGDESFLDHSTPSRLPHAQYRSSPFRSSPLQAKQPRLISTSESRYSPYANARPARSHERYVSRGRPSPPRSLLEHAWHVVARSDPLADSDDEMGDEHCRVDYEQRLNIVCRLRGKEPTPEPE